MRWRELSGGRYEMERELSGEGMRWRELSGGRYEMERVEWGKV